MKIEIVRVYDEIEDPEMNSDVLRTEFYIGGNEVMSEDYYHDKIESRIEGFLHALQVLKIEYTVERKKVLGSV